MVLQRLSLYNFRSYDERQFELSPQTTMIVGKNGAGKTNILEAIYTLLQGKSFRDTDEELLQYDQEWWKITGSFDQGERELRYQLGKPSPKQLVIDGVVKGRFTYKQQLPVVLFEPDDLFMLHASPGVRRLYIDTLLLKLVPSYRTTLARYERSLLQRNNLLKKDISFSSLRDAVFVWDIALSENGSEIIRQRQHLISQLNEQLSQNYSHIAGTPHTVTVEYLSSNQPDAQTLVGGLTESLERDKQRGFTSIGPHRDDIAFFINGKPAKSTASRGEVRTLLLALKQVEVALVKVITGRMAVYLMDDVFSELDEERQVQMLHSAVGVQTVITSATFIEKQYPGTDYIKLDKS
jgi:DNA replication and repair protein RecF